MPLHDMLCTNCGHIGEIFKHMNDPFPDRCPACEVKGHYSAMPSRVHTDLHDFHTPIKMYSVACNSRDEIREIQRKCPDVEIATDPKHEDYGVPVARNRKQKLDVLRATGFVEKN